jgi:two-component sensor histidine kinase
MASLHGVAPDHVPNYDAWLARIDLADRTMMHAAMAALLAGTSDHFEATYRYICPNGAQRWIWSRGSVIQHDPATGQAVRVAGVSRDDTERRDMDARRELLAREVDHRAKNALAVVQSVVKLTKASSVGEYARAVEGRISALTRVHDLLSRNTWAGAELRDIVLHELAPYRPTRDSGSPGQVILAGPDVTLAASAAQPLSMALHELATNAAKYGALSTSTGMLKVSWAIEPAAGALRLRWVERGGPVLTSRPSHRGFGSRVLDGTIRHQIGGSLTLLWEPEGLVCDVYIPPRQVTAVHVEGQPRNG